MLTILTIAQARSANWTAEAGKYEVKVGASSRDIRQTASFELESDLISKKESVALVPKVDIHELSLAR